MVQMGPKNMGELDEALCRHFILNMLLTIRKTHRAYGDMVIACDSPPYWRKYMFEHYKAKRKDGREQSHIDWGKLFEIAGKVREEIKANFHYKVLEVNGVEADDIIAVLAKNTQEPTMVIARDKDFIQLLQHPHVRLWDVTKKQLINHPNPKRALFEHVMQGDGGDGIPNILSDDDTFVTKGKRSRALTKKIKALLDGCENYEMAAGIVPGYWDRNKKLIDFDFIPKDIEDRILTANRDYIPNETTDVLNYLASHKLRKLLESSSEF